MTGQHTQVAVLGLGTIGGAIAEHLGAASFRVRAWNRTMAVRPTPKGAELVATPAEAVSEAAAVITALTDGAAVTEVAGAMIEDLPRGAIWIQASTISPEETLSLAGMAESRGVRFIDAPVLGSLKQAVAGTLVVLGGAGVDARESAEAFLSPFASRVIWAGEVGAGTRLKLVVNNVGLALVQTTAETVALAQSLGVSVELLLEAIEGGPFGAPVIADRARLLLEEDPRVNVRLDIGAKDAGLVLGAAANAGLQLAVTSAVHAQLTAACEAGLGDRDLSATFTLLATQRAMNKKQRTTGEPDASENR